MFKLEFSSPFQERHHCKVGEGVDLRHVGGRRQQVGPRVGRRNHVLEDGQGMDGESRTF